MFYTAMLQHAAIIIDARQELGTNRHFLCRLLRHERESAATAHCTLRSRLHFAVTLRFATNYAIFASCCRRLRYVATATRFTPMLAAITATPSLISPAAAAARHKMLLIAMRCFRRHMLLLIFRCALRRSYI